MYPEDLYLLLLLISQLTPNFDYKAIKIFILKKEIDNNIHFITMLIHYACRDNAILKHTISSAVLAVLQFEHASYSYNSFISNASFHEEVKVKHKLFN